MRKFISLQFLLLISLVSISRAQEEQIEQEIEGRYEVYRVGRLDILKPIIVTLEHSRITIKGCYKSWSFYQYDSWTGQWKIIDEFESTEIQCENSQDSVIIDAIKQTVKVVLIDDELMFYDQDDTQTLCLKEIIPVKASDILGEFQLISINEETKPLKTIILKLTKQGLNFKGCNHVSTRFTYNQKTTQWKGDQFVQTQMACEQDQDGLIINALANAKKAFRENELLLFKNDEGSQVLKLRVLGKNKQKSSGNKEEINSIVQQQQNEAEAAEQQS